MARKVTTKDIHLNGIKHAKETIVALLNNQASLVAMLNRYLATAENQHQADLADIDAAARKLLNELDL